MRYHVILAWLHSARYTTMLRWIASGRRSWQPSGDLHDGWGGAGRFGFAPALFIFSFVYIVIRNIETKPIKTTVEGPTVATASDAKATALRRTVIAAETRRPEPST